jgi:hypothetical protein
VFCKTLNVLYKPDRFFPRGYKKIKSGKFISTCFALENKGFSEQKNISIIQSSETMVFLGKNEGFKRYISHSGK